MIRWGERSTFLARDLIHFSLLSRLRNSMKTSALRLSSFPRNPEPPLSLPLAKGEKEGVKDSGARAGYRQLCRNDVTKVHNQF